MCDMALRFCFAAQSFSSLFVCLHSALRVLRLNLLHAQGLERDSQPTDQGEGDVSSSPQSDLAHRPLPSLKAVRVIGSGLLDLIKEGLLRLTNFDLAHADGEHDAGRVDA